MRDKNTFGIANGTHIGIRTVINEDWDTFNAIRKLLTSNGFLFHQDQDVKKRHRCLARTHFHGQYGDLQFKAKIYPVGMEFEFYQDIVHENPHGGYYDFNKLEKMPYVIRLRFFWTLNKIVRLLEDMGFENHTKPVYKTALEKVMQHRAEVEAFHGKNFYVGARLSYNAKDADGNCLEDGMFRYFRDYNGRLLRGTIYHNLNNMWWVVVNKDCYRNIAAFELFELNESVFRGRCVHPRRRKSKLESLLATAISNQDFEKAIVYRDLLKAAAS